MATAEITILGLGRASASASEYIAEIQRRLAAQDRVRFQMQAMGTELEGSTEDILAVVGQLHRVPLEMGLPRVYTVLKLDERADRPDQTLEDKVRSVQQKLDGQPASDGGTDSYRGASHLPPIVARLVSVEHDPERAQLAREIVTTDPRVSVVTGEFTELEGAGPFDLLCLDGEGQGKQGEEPVDVARWLVPDGTVVMDDYSPSPRWPAQFEGEVDVIRMPWLEHPGLSAAEIRTEPDRSAIVAARRPIQCREWEIREQCREWLGVADGRA